jgi:uncharacterized membrane protein YeaQ/YmgE (transglycosylase-associated protein family)
VFQTKGDYMIWTLFVGLIVGIIAKFLMPGRDPGGFIITAFLGIAGSVLAYFVGSSLGWYAQGEPAGLIASVVGAIILLAAYRAYVTKHPRVVHH